MFKIIIMIIMITMTMRMITMIMRMTTITMISQQYENMFIKVDKPTIQKGNNNVSLSDNTIPATS